LCVSWHYAAHSASVGLMHTQAENEEMLKSIADACSGTIIPASQAIDFMGRLQKKTVNPTTVFRGPLEIGPDCKIPVYCYCKTKKEVLCLLCHSRARGVNLVRACRPVLP
jgi:hypothetical protein